MIFVPFSRIFKKGGAAWLPCVCVCAAPLWDLSRARVLQALQGGLKYFPIPTPFFVLIVTDVTCLSLTAHGQVCAYKSRTCSHFGGTPVERSTEG